MSEQNQPMSPEELREWRESLKPISGNRSKVSRREAAERLNTPLRTYEGWECGQARIPGAVPLACAAILYGIRPYPARGGDDGGS